MYQVDGRVLEAETKRAIAVSAFAAIAGVTSKQPLRSILLTSSVVEADGSGYGGAEAGTSLEDLLIMHGSSDQITNPS